MNLLSTEPGPVEAPDLVAPDPDVFICEPRGASSDERYLVAHVKPRSIRMFRTGRLWSAMEVRDAWLRGNFVNDSGQLRRLPNPPLCVMTP